MRLAVLIALFAAMLLTGCTQTRTTSNDFTGERKQVADRVADLADDGQRKRADAICENLLADELVKQVSAAGSSCAAEMKKAIDDADDFDLDVQKVTVSGSTATADVRRGDDGPTVTMRFAKENGQWRATSLSG